MHFATNFSNKIYNLEINIHTIMSKHKLKTNSVNEPPVKKGHWALGLIDSMKDPKLKIEEDDKVVVIKDKFPKAEYHYLILPKQEIPGILSLREEHEGLLEHMENVANRLTVKHGHREFKIGYHSVPNMQRLHLHVISTDFNSPCLKTKVHYNSYTTPFFKSSQNIREELRVNGKIKKMSCEECDEYLKSSTIVCHKCTMVQKNMPALKKHLLSHIQDEPDTE